ncbi:GT2 family glycosyltransferase [Mucilaginibacter frigoritolerans]|uniref:GT2 family glycosyltransferase n=1 Tax=Mucilaginibacter frigoritolerans TaxID=652788 RepID=A0A562U3R6_9SPHI|nr:glycosyltransferase family 2 protein [Mucilaginibacter frigoritolerans]TWI99956.1 GT2 family glycosyltransferase [Mucilaginibacter frigoritolerans]
MEIKKSVSVVIPNYNGKHLLKEYLPYTYTALNKAGIVYELIIVDDCSKDDSVEFIKTEYPEVKLVVNPVNKGFSFACNRGIEVTQHELILILNSDVKLSADYFEQQWKYFLAWDTFGVMGRIIDMEGDDIQDAARVPKFNGLKLKTDYFCYTNDESSRLYTFYLSGANALVDAEKLKQLGGFSEIFSPFYCEDMELSIRAWRLGWKCYYEHNSICRHQVSASTKNYETAQWVKSIYFRNRFYLHAIHLNGVALMLWYMQITLIDLIPKLLGGHTWIWNSYKELFRNRALIHQYKNKFKQLLTANSSRITIFNVVTKIRSSVKDKKLHKFKP